MVVAYRKAEADEVPHRHESHQNGRTEATGQVVPPIPSATDLEQALRHAMWKRSGGRVRALQVRILGDRIVLSGWAESFHAVQLALAGLFEAFRTHGLDKPEQIELDIDVLPRVPTANPRP